MPENLVSGIENNGIWRFFNGRITDIMDLSPLIDILRTSAAKSPNADCTGERVIGPDGSAGGYL
jgi:hypothetical protein